MPTLTTPDAAEYVSLRGGLVVPLPALQLAWRLEDLGCQLEADHGRLILDRPNPDPLTADDREQLRRWKRHLVAIVDYVNREGWLM